MTWQRYINKRGSLNVGRRLEAGFALLAFMQNRLAGGKAKMEDFMPHEAPASKPLNSDDAIMAYFKEMEKKGG